MAKRYNPSLIGGFVLGGIALLVGAMFLFGSGDLFRERTRWVTFFEGSVGGLDEGAPVNFRGVRVGTVTAVALQVDPATLSAYIPVYFDIDPERIAWIGDTAARSPELAVQAGLRAKLDMQSFVTGQMQVELDLLPDTPARLVGSDPTVPEVPSVPSELEALKKQITELPWEELVTSLDRAARGVEQLVSAPELRETLQNLAAAMIELQSLLANVNLEAQPMMKEIAAAATSMRKTSDQAADSLRTIDGELQTTLGEVRELTSTAKADLTKTLRQADLALRQARTTIAGIDNLLGDGTPSRQDIETTLQNLAQASFSLRSFADTVERSPNALILGR